MLCATTEFAGNVLILSDNLTVLLFSLWWLLAAVSLVFIDLRHGCF